MADIIIRPAQAAEQPQIRTMVRRARINPFQLHWPNFLIAEVDGQLAGVGQIRPHKDGTPELASLAVSPAFQNQGVGSELVHALVQKAPTPLYLMCVGKMAPYYVKFGFQAVDPTEERGIVAHKVARGKQVMGWLKKFGIHGPEPTLMRRG